MSRTPLLLLAAAGLALSAPAARPQPDAPGTLPLTRPPAVSYALTMSELLGVRGSEARTNAGDPLCVLFVVDVSGSMNAIRQDTNRSRIDAVQRALQRLVQSDGLAHPRSTIGMLRAGPEDPGPAGFTLPLGSRTDPEGLDRAIRSITSLEPGRDLGSNLRAAHYRGLQAMRDYCEAPENRDTPWKRYLILLSDCYLDGPREGGPADPAQRIFRTLQQPSQPDYQDWVRLSAETTTLVMEPFNPGWLGGPAKLEGSRRNVFPDDVAAVTPGLRVTDWAGRSIPLGVVEGICLRGPQGSSGAIRSVPALKPDSEYGAELLPDARPRCAVTRGEQETLLDNPPYSANGRFFFVVEFPSHEPGASQEVRLSASRPWYRSRAAIADTLQPGQRLAYEITLGPALDWRVPLLALLALVLLVWLLWPWELRINNAPAPAILWLLQPVQLYDRDTNRPVATVYHFFLNWLSVKGKAGVRVNGSTSRAFALIPSRCTVEISTQRTATFILESGFMKPGRRGGRGKGPAGPAARSLPPRPGVGRR